MKKGKVPYSILELASVPAGASAGEVFKNSLLLAQNAERWGYTRFWLAEHHNMISIASSATPVLIGHIASGTKSIRVGSGGVMLPNHAPLIVAEQFGTLGSLFPHRIDLGLGRAPGTDQETAYAIRRERMHAAYRFPEEVGEIQQYFADDNADEKVRAYVAEGVDVPLYILGSSTDSAHLAAKKGLPYAFASHFAPTHLFEALNVYYNEFQPSAALQEPYTIACVNVVAADTNKRDQLRPPAPLEPQIRAFMDEPAFQRFLHYAFVGSKETVKEKTSDFLHKTGVNEIMVASHMYSSQDRLRSYELFAELMKEM
jgi:luciferase family oxidoreductase group 1